MLRRIVAGATAGTLANAIQMLICLVDDRSLTPSLFVSHWLFVMLFHVAVATLFAKVSSNRLWQEKAYNTRPIHRGKSSH